MNYGQLLLFLRGIIYPKRGQINFNPDYFVLGKFACVYIYYKLLSKITSVDKLEASKLAFHEAPDTEQKGPIRWWESPTIDSLVQLKKLASDLWKISKTIYKFVNQTFNDNAHLSNKVQPKLENFSPFDWNTCKRTVSS